ncbi:hypothetical protein PRIPAC_93885 [Pristionchus pacificus]|uniref:Uncharacterized protein n=1 Tax=Pristionchus pacificus TaxID=54126 RepID=A0A2A6BQG1_PRIPA|nr:hypothetical protein PRIPAC_93885 [Pristionchus pacificus]|eukprot:PDM68001.1 hypothetical protein PRIPAC_46045 [Pristionchus pacificus]
MDQKRTGTRLCRTSYEATIGMSSADPFFAWYHSPLSLEDCLAAGSLLLLCGIFIPLTALVAYVMYKADKEIIGYRYLISASFADINCMLQYGFFNAVAILTKNSITHDRVGRDIMHFWINWMWFAFCLHYPLVAWSRFAAIKFPIWFRTQRRWHSYAICGFVYLVAFIMVCITHWWFIVRFYYEPAAYGLLADDFVKYLTGGHSAMFMYLHIFCVVFPLILYLLLIPCIFGNIIFVAITIGTGTGKWATWAICFIFVINSAANCVMLLLFSPSLRSSILPGGTAKKKKSTSRSATVSVVR